MTTARRVRISLFVIVAIALTVGLIAAYQAWDRRSMLNATLTWGRLAPLPVSMRDYSITTTGTAFSREFRASFTAPKPDIEQWLDLSPGTRDVVPKRVSPTTRRFTIKPGGGAQFAEVEIDDDTGLVKIHVWWS